MKTLRILLMVCIMLGFAVSANSQKNDKARPMKGTFYASVVATNGAVETLSVTGNATHLGNFTGTMYFDKTFMVLNPTTHGIEIKGVRIFGTLVAANGDEIVFGPDDPGMVITGAGPKGIMSGEVTLKPGSGRFANCSGVIVTTGIFDMGNDYAKWTARGTIIY